MNPYETDKLLNEYLLFHYGSADDVLPWPDGPRGALDYAVRCVTECVDPALGGRALDVGCAVGRSSFELARLCGEVIGVDWSRRFIEVAQVLAATGSFAHLRADEGALATPMLARVPAGIECGRVSFEHGDAQALRAGLGSFDMVLAANLVDRLVQPQRFLDQLPALVRPGGQLVISSPYTWMEEFTPSKHWLGGFIANDRPRTTLEGMRQLLKGAFDLEATRELPFLIREHARKFQWSVAQASIWRRKA
jgi:putative 4-mercaptohistidine N1-methyltranferase